jgi:mannose-6-phosphate isomerase-like protein (cupin superfamily)
MHIPSGNRQRGLHYHSVTEMYMILRGEVLGWDGHGEAHRAGPIDCIYISASVPHGIRCYGDEPVDLIWIHDAIERKDTSVYWDEGMRNPQDESKEEIKVVPFKDLEPSWAAGHAENLCIQ